MKIRGAEIGAPTRREPLQVPDPLTEPARTEPSPEPQHPHPSYPRPRKDPVEVPA